MMVDCAQLTDASLHLYTIDVRYSIGLISLTITHIRRGERLVIYRICFACSSVSTLLKRDSFCNVGSRYRLTDIYYSYHTVIPILISGMGPVQFSAWLIVINSGRGCS